jgi:hypothetical protein
MCTRTTGPRTLDLLTDLGRADAGSARGLGAGGGADLEAPLRLMDRAGVANCSSQSVY